MLISDLLAMFVNWNLENRAKRTAEFYHAEISAWLEALGDKPISEVRAADLVLHAKSRARITAVQRMFRWAQLEAEVIAENPVARVRKPRVGKRTRVLNSRESVALLRAAAADFRDLLFAVRESATRPQEVRAVEWDCLEVADQAADYWSQVRNGHGFFVLAEYKARNRRADGGPPRLVPISPRLGRLLYRLFRRGSGNGPVFLTRAGQAWTKNAVVLRMRRARVKAGLGKGRKGESVCMYTLRHSTATEWGALGLAGPIIQQLLGHSSLETTQRYLHLERMKSLETARDVLHRRRPRGGSKR